MKSRKTSYDKSLEQKEPNDREKKEYMLALKMFLKKYRDLYDEFCTHHAFKNVDFREVEFGDEVGVAEIAKYIRNISYNFEDEITAKTRDGW